MGKSRQHAMLKKRRPNAIFARKHAPRSPSLNAEAQPVDVPPLTALAKQRETIFTFLPDSAIVCDQKGEMLRINTAALKLFEIYAETQWRGKNVQAFLEQYGMYDEQQRPFSLKQWLTYSLIQREVICSPPETYIAFEVPSGQRIAVNMSCSPLGDAQKQVSGMVIVFHEISQRYQHALHLQRVHEAVLTLTQAIAHLPERIPRQIAGALPEGSLLFSPPVVFIAQQLVNVIRQVMDCHWVILKALRWPGGYVHYVTGSGFTPEQESPERAIGGLHTLSNVFEETVVARLFEKKEVTLRGDRMLYLPGAPDFSSESLLLIPLFLENQLAGVLKITKAGVTSVYTSEEIALVKALAAHALLVIEYLGHVHKQVEAHARERALQEMHQLSKDFLILASHELRTPLTGILGNLQLAQRRLETLTRQVASQAEHVGEYVAQAQQPLASAEQSARLQQRMINDIIDDARIQAKQLEVRLKRCNLLALLKAVVDTQQQITPEHVLALDRKTTAQEVFVLADAERVTQVFNTYLTNALAYSSARSPVTVQLAVEDSVAQVSVHNEGPGIPYEEQKHLWERFYRTKGYAVQHELDLSLGLGLYLCRAYIEHQAGSVGVQSAPDQGATFWFTLPIAPKE
jgi:PAS domain S-box-containing protein